MSHLRRRIPKVCECCGKDFLARIDGPGRFCSNACLCKGRTPSREERFWTKVQKTETCWLWTGSTASGYGRLHAPTEHWMISAHRFSWELHYGPIPDGQCVCHHCDNRKCVRPDHLFLGTPAENYHDMLMKKRHAYGERGSASKLTTEQVKEILQADLSIRGSQIALARKFGVSKNAINSILKRRNWVHINPA